MWILKGVSVDATWDRPDGSARGFTLLMLACVRGLVGLVETLLRHGARTGPRNSAGATALIIAAEGEPGIVEMLVERGARLDAKNKGGSSPLHIAAVKGQTAAARVLLELGADPDQICAHSRHLRAVLTDGLRSVGAMAAQVGAKKALALIDPAGPLRLRYGSAVTIDGIHSRPELNGQRGVVVSFHTALPTPCSVVDFLAAFHSSFGEAVPEQWQRFAFAVMSVMTATTAQVRGPISPTHSDCQTATAHTLRTYVLRHGA